MSLRNGKGASETEKPVLFLLTFSQSFVRLWVEAGIDVCSF